MASMEPRDIRTGKKPEGKIPQEHLRYDVRWRCNEGCPRHPRGGKNHKKTFLRSKEAQVFELERTREELSGETVEQKATTPMQTFGEFAGLYIEGGRVKVREDEGWFFRYRTNPKITPSTYKRRTDANHWLAELIALPLDRVTYPIVEDLVTGVAARHPRTAKVVLETIKMILRNAHVRGVENIDTKVLMRPKDGGIDSPQTKPADRKPKVFLTQEQVAQLAAYAETHGYGDLLWFAALTGLRQKELFNLTDADLRKDDDGKIVAIHIRRETTKSDAGVRTIPLSKQARTHLLASMMRRKPGSRYLFTAKRGGQVLVGPFDTLLRKWRNDLRADALRAEDIDPTQADEERTVWDRFTTHDLRHTFAAWMIHAGVNPKALQKLMGHENWSVTMDTYGHLFPDATQEAMDIFERYLRPSDVSADEEEGTEEASSR